jgi:iron complex transport system permease protein
MVALSPPVVRRLPGPTLSLALAALLLVVAVLSLTTGAAGLGLGDLFAGLWGEGLSPRDQIVLFDIRLPRLGLGMAVGASLAVSGVLLQGLFRNPLADPGIVGVSSGASLGAVLAIVLGGALPTGLSTAVGPALIPLFAGLCGWATTLILYRVATSGNRTDVALMLLAGIALSALAAAVMGVLIYLADDRQLRDLTFWSMGSLAGATWSKLWATLPLMGLVVLAAPRLARGLNSLSLGEAQAAHMGVDVQHLKRVTILVAAAATGVAVAISGGIGFIGLVVPHLLRQAQGPDHRPLIPHAALLGAALLVLADLIARSIVAPAELPIGILTALIGAPVFLWTLLQRGARGG